MPDPSLSAQSDTHLRLAVALARKLSTAMVIAGQKPDDPQPGDLVVERTGWRIDPDAIGWLVGHGDAPYHEDDPLDGSVPMREVWDIQPLSGRTQEDRAYARWENAEFVKLPESIAAMLKEEPSVVL